VAVVTVSDDLASPDASAPGSVAQVRECTSLMQVAKREDITLLIVGHVTKRRDRGTKGTRTPSRYGAVF